jgi:hypothetical protein
MRKTFIFNHFTFGRGYFQISTQVAEFGVKIWGQNYVGQNKKAKRGSLCVNKKYFLNANLKIG